MSNLIACRPSSYGQFPHLAWTHLPTLGIRHLELPVPAPGEIDDVKRKLADAGMFVSSLEANCDVRKADAAEVIQPQLEACTELGAELLFLSAKAGEVDRNVIYDRLRAMGDAAEKLGVTIVMETHPDLVTNGDVGRETMAAVNHTHVRVNFDTANIYYYNEGRNAVDELTKEIEFVSAVHLKESGAGKHEEWNFPALGEGVVDFPAVFRMLAERGFAGPYTLELEGVAGKENEEAAQRQMVESSVAYLRSIGVME